MAKKQTTTPLYNPSQLMTSGGNGIIDNFEKFRTSSEGKDYFRMMEENRIAKKNSGRIDYSNIDPITDVALPLAGIAGTVGKQVIKQGAKQVGKYLTEKTALKNAYKVNPLAFKPDKNAYYRMLGDGVDAYKSKEIRPNPNNLSPDGVPTYGVSHFSKGRPWNSRELGTAGYKGPYMTELKNYPMDGFTGAGWPKEELGNVKLDNPNLKIYKEDWLKGYKQVPKMKNGGEVMKKKYKKQCKSTGGQILGTAGSATMAVNPIVGGGLMAAGMVVDLFAKKKEEERLLREEQLLNEKNAMTAMGTGLAKGGEVKNKPSNLFRTDQTAYVDSVLATNQDKDWVRRLHEKNAPSIPDPNDPSMRSSHLMSDDGNGYVFPSVIRENGKLKHLDSEDKAIEYARKTNTGIQLPKEQGTWFANNGYKTGTGVMNDINDKTGVLFNNPKYKVPTNFAKGGEIKGKGTGTSDSIPAKLEKGDFIVPAKNAEIALKIRNEHFGEMEDKATLKDGDVPVNVSDGEVRFTKDEMEYLDEIGEGSKVRSLAPDATEPIKPGGKYADGVRGKAGKNGKITNAKQLAIEQTYRDSLQNLPSMNPILKTTTTTKLNPIQNTLAKTTPYTPPGKPSSKFGKFTTENAGAILGGVQAIAGLVQGAKNANQERNLKPIQSNAAIANSEAIETKMAADKAANAIMAGNTAEADRATGNYMRIAKESGGANSATVLANASRVGQSSSDAYLKGMTTAAQIKMAGQQAGSEMKIKAGEQDTQVDMYNDQAERRLLEAKSANANNLLASGLTNTGMALARSDYNKKMDYLKKNVKNNLTGQEIPGFKKGGMVKKYKSSKC